MAYWLSRIVPIHFSAIYGVEISETEVTEGGHGNHFRSGAHFDAETASWWQWRDRYFRHRTVRICLP